MPTVEVLIELMNSILTSAAFALAMANTSGSGSNCNYASVGYTLLDEDRHGSRNSTDVNDRFSGLRAKRGEKAGSPSAFARHYRDDMVVLGREVGSRALGKGWWSVIGHLRYVRYRSK